MIPSYFLRWEALGATLWTGNSTHLDSWERSEDSMSLGLATDVFAFRAQSKWKVALWTSRLGPIPSLGIYVYIYIYFWHFLAYRMQTSAEKIREDSSYCFGSVAKEELALCLGETFPVHGQMDRLLKANWQKWASKMMPWACLKPGDCRMPQTIKRSKLGRRSPDWTKRHAQPLGRILKPPNWNTKPPETSGQGFKNISRWVIVYVCIYSYMIYWIAYIIIREIFTRIPDRVLNLGQLYPDWWTAAPKWAVGLHSVFHCTGWFPLFVRILCWFYSRAQLQFDIYCVYIYIYVHIFCTLQIIYVKNTYTGDTAKGSFVECPTFAAVPS